MGDLFKTKQGSGSSGSTQDNENSLESVLSSIDPQLVQEIEYDLRLMAEEEANKQRATAIQVQQCAPNSEDLTKTPRQQPPKTPVSASRKTTITPGGTGTPKVTSAILRSGSKGAPLSAFESPVVSTPVSKHSISQPSTGSAIKLRPELRSGNGSKREKLLTPQAAIASIS